jgi:tryptophan synthase alpha chain
MNRIDELFERKRNLSQRSLIIYLTAGYPSLQISETLIKVLSDAGLDLLELGVPFSDPIADGPTIQKASAHSLEQGTTLAKILDMVSRIRKNSQMPIVLFSAYNPLLKYGLKGLVERAADIGIDGFLAPDLPPEEAEEFMQLCEARDLKLIFLVAPTTPETRKRLIADKSTGFIYYVSTKGVTGAREQLSRDLQEQLRQLTSYTDKPVAVGFGISKPEHVELVASFANGVVVGSALINLIEKHATSPDLSGEVRRFVEWLQAPLRR